MPPEVVQLQQVVQGFQAAIPKLIERARAGDPAVMALVGQLTGQLGTLLQDVLQVVPQ